MTSWIPDHFKTQDMWIEALETDPWQLNDIPDHFKTRDMCNKAVRIEPFLLADVPVSVY